MIENDIVMIDRGPAFLEIARQISDYLNILPLANSQHNGLVELIVKQVNEAENAAFTQGLDMGVKVGRHLAEHPDTPPEYAN